MRSYRYLHFDVFTDRLFGGNQLAVFLDGRGLSSDDMQAIAREMNFSESTFLLPAEQPGTDLRVRIFTPGEELPMAGHPTIGTAFALARAGVVSPEINRIVFGLGVGPTPVSLIWRGRELSFAWMTQRPPVFGEPFADVAAVARALRLPAAAVAGAGLPVQVVSCGVEYLLVPIATRRAVDSASLDPIAYDALRTAAGLADNVPVYLFSPQSSRDDKAVAYGRMFGPGIGVTEDPATGSAAGPLGCHLVRHKVVTAGKAGKMTVLQGVKMGRPSTMHVAIGLSGRDISSVRVGGEAVLAGEGTLYVP